MVSSMDVCVYVCSLWTQGSVIAESVLSSAVSDADIVLEAVIDNLDIKNSLIKGECHVLSLNLSLLQ